jgi:polyisoprenoid-binding protein YceI
MYIHNIGTFKQLLIMKKISLFLFASLLSISTIAQTWSLDKAHSGLGFSITHMMISEVDGNFKAIEAKMTSSKADLSDAVLELTAETASINTGNDMRDGHLKGKDYFNSDVNKALVFKSTSVKKVKGENYKIMGNITINGITKPIVLMAVIKGPVEHPRSKKQMLGIKATGKINRVDFKVGGSGGGLGDEVEIKATGEFVKD